MSTNTPTPHAELINTLLSDVKQFTQLCAADSQLHPHQHEHSLERQKLSGKISNTFRAWTWHCMGVSRTEECTRSDNGAASSCGVCQEISKVGDACMTLMNMSWKAAAAVRRQRGKNTTNNEGTTTNEVIPFVDGGFPDQEELNRSSSSSKHNNDNDEDDDEDLSRSVAVDPTVRLVLDCAAIFFCPGDLKPDNALVNGHCAATLFDFSSSSPSSSPHSLDADAAAFRANSYWRRLLISLCERTSARDDAMELSEKGFRLLVGWLAWAAETSKHTFEQKHPTAITFLLLDALGFTNQRSADSPSTEEKMIVEELLAVNAQQEQQQKQHPSELLAASTKFFPRQASDQTFLTRVTSHVLRCSSAMNERFANSTNRRFCRATHFDALLGAILLKNVNCNGDDPGILVALFLSSSHTAHCCGPSSIAPAVCKIISKYLVLPAAKEEEEEEEEEKKQEEGADAAASSYSSLDESAAAIFAPFAHLSVIELLQRGTVADEEQQKREKERRRNAQARGQQQQQQGGEAAAAAAEENTADDNPWLVPLETFPVAAIEPLAEALLLRSSPAILARSDRDDVDTWVRSVTALFSSSAGIHTANKVLSSSASSSSLEKKNISRSGSSWGNIFDVASTVAEISRAMLLASANNVSARVNGLNAIQSCAVPLSTLISKNKKVQQHTSGGQGGEGEESALLLFQIRFIGATLAAMLHAAPISDAINQDGGRPAGAAATAAASAFFAKNIFPMGRGVGVTVEEQVHEAFWSMLEQLIVAPPVAELERMMEDSSAQSKQLVKSFVENFVNPVIAPLCPMLASMLCTTAQKELGLSLYQRRRPLVLALLRYESLTVKWMKKQAREEDEEDGDEGDFEVPQLVCGCSSVMWEKLRDTMMIDGQ